MTRKLKRVTQFLRERAEFTPGQVRWWIFNAPSNGMDRCGVVVRIGRAIWIDEGAFDRWIESQNPALDAKAGEA